MSSSPEKQLKKILSQPPKPLYYETEKQSLALFFSAKAGCTFAIQWFFYHIGLLESARSYHKWVHKYRNQIFYKLPEYQENISNILNPKTKIIKIVRNPYNRVVSFYIHAILHGYENPFLSKFLQREVNKNQGYSFKEFLSYLEVINLEECNTHHRIQVHKAEWEKLVIPDYIVRLEKSFEELRQVEAELSLNVSSVETLKSFAKTGHATERKDFNEFVGYQSFNSQNLKKNQPEMLNFYNDELKEKVAHLYEIDFLAYNYDINNLVSQDNDTLSERKHHFEQSINSPKDK